MSFKLRFVSLMAAIALAAPLTACGKAPSAPEIGDTDASEKITLATPEASESSRDMTSPAPESTAPVITTEAPETEDIPDETTGVDDVVEPLNRADSESVEVMAEADLSGDFSDLDGECRGYGQGVRFDEMNRPKGALEFNEENSRYNAEAIREDSGKTINLTFDQGYENGFTGKILDTLKEKGVKATFFIVGDYAERQPELVQRMIDEGHRIGSHSVNHYSMPSLSYEECRDEIMGLHEYIRDNFGVEMDIFRPPMGEYSERSLAVTGSLGYKTVLWSFAYADWDTKNQPDPASSLEKLKERAHDGAIYLLHSVSETNASILGDFIDEMQKEGYEFSTEF